MTKTNKLLTGIALVGALMGHSKAQEMGPTIEEPKNVITSVISIDGVDNTNQVSSAETVTNTTIQAVIPTNMPIQVQSATNVAEQVTAPTNMTMVATNDMTTATNMTTVATNEMTTATNTVAATTNTMAAATNTVTSVTNAATTVQAPVLTERQKALQQEILAQIPPELMAIKNGMPLEQLFTLCGLMHMEQSIGTHDLSVSYWKAAEAGMDLKPFEEAYRNRAQDQQSFLKACQMGIADARINNKSTFTVSGVMFDADSPKLIENLLKFKDAKDDGKETVIIEDRPFRILRTPEEMRRMPRRQKDIPNRIITPYGSYIRESR